VKTSNLTLIYLSRQVKCEVPTLLDPLGNDNSTPSAFSYAQNPLSLTLSAKAGSSLGFGNALSFVFLLEYKAMDKA
jgi:hypothetical protein